MFRSGFILSPRADLVWFLGLPFAAIAVALACYHWLPAMAWASIALWITMPHHWATWLRTYGLREDWQRWKGPLIVGPLVIGGMTLLGLTIAPITVIMLGILWDLQHSLMQQHGFGRIYDFKARAGSALTGRFDLFLHWVLFVNMLITSPLFTLQWVRELHRWDMPVTPTGVHWMQYASWAITALYLAVYCGHSIWCSFAGYALNPIKYLFIFSSYFLWYAAAWHTDSFLVFAIAHRLMHGIQYSVIVHSYLRHKVTKSKEQQPFLAWLVQSRTALVFIVLGLVYAVIYQIVVLRPLDEFAFGLIKFSSMYGEVPLFGLAAVSKQSGYDLFALMLTQALPLTHCYFDTFIWKVSDAATQRGL